MVANRSYEDKVFKLVQR